MLYKIVECGREPCKFEEGKETHMEERGGFGYFLLGLGIGVAAGILWAPRAGEETRQLIAEKAGEGADYLKSRAQEGTEYVRQKADDIKGTAADLYEKGRQTVNRQKDTLTAAADAAKQAYRDAVTDAKSTVAGQAAGGTNAG
jgi:gas vesicle protein